MTGIIIIITGLISIWAFQTETSRQNSCSMHYGQAFNQWYRVVSHAFIHAGWMVVRKHGFFDFLDMLNVWRICLEVRHLHGVIWRDSCLHYVRS